MSQAGALTGLADALILHPPAAVNVADRTLKKVWRHGLAPSKNGKGRSEIRAAF